MANYKISLDLSGLQDIAQVLRDTMLVQVSKAVMAVAQNVQTDWKSQILRSGGHGGLWQGERDAYSSSVQWKPVTELSAVVWSDYKSASEIESGRPVKDLKQMLQTSKKTRLSKAGKRYLIIPFRHNTPGNSAHAAAMPSNVHAVVSSQSFSTSKITGHGKRISASGDSVRSRQYLWGSRLPEGMAPKLKPSHKADPYAGMVRMNTSSGAQKSSAYLTFRVMVEGSSGWIVPARPGLFIVQGVIDRMKPAADKTFSDAMSNIAKMV